MSKPTTPLQTITRHSNIRREITIRPTDWTIIVTDSTQDGAPIGNAEMSYGAAKWMIAELQKAVAIIDAANAATSSATETPK